MESFVVHMASENMLGQICSVFGNEGSMTQNASHATFQGLMTSSLVLKQNEIDMATYMRGLQRWLASLTKKVKYLLETFAVCANKRTQMT